MSTGPPLLPRRQVPVVSPSVSTSPTSKPAFLAAYGLELEDGGDDDDDDDDNDELGGGADENTLIPSKRGKKPGRGLMKRTFSPTRRLSATPSQDSQDRRSPLVSMARSISSHSRSDSTSKSVVSPNILPKKEGGKFQRLDRARSPSSPKDQIATATVSANPRRGVFADDTDNDMDDGSSSVSPVPTLATSIPQLENDTTSTNVTKYDDTSSSTYDGESWESGSGKASEVPVLPSRPVLATLEANAVPVTVVQEINSPSTRPALPPRRSIAPSDSAVSRTATVNTKKEAKKEAKEEAKLIAAQEKAILLEKKNKKVEQESRKKREERERKVLMKSYEELEVERFLTDFGKHVSHVRSTGVLNADLEVHAWPKKEDWRLGKTHQLNVIGYGFACISSIIAYLSPHHHSKSESANAAEDVQEPTQDEQFRVAALRGNAERLYMTALPMYEGLFANLRKVWRWESKGKTTLWCGGYFIFWYRGMLLPALFALMICSVLLVGSYPPEPDVLRKMIRQQQRRAMELQQVKEAKAGDVLQQAQEQITPTNVVDNTDATTSTTATGAAAAAAAAATTTKAKKSKYGLAADATRRYGKVATMLTSALADIHERIKNFIMWRSVPATWRALALLSVAMILTTFTTPWMMARVPGFGLGACFFLLGPIMEYRPEWLGVEWKNPFDFLLAGVPNDAQCAMIVLRKRAARGETLVGDKDVAHWIFEGEEGKASEEESRRVEIGQSLVPSMGGLEATESVTMVTTAVDKAATSGTSSVDWKKWKSRVAKGREMAIAGSEMLSGQRAVELPRLNAAPTNAENAAVTSKMMNGMAKGINWGLGSLQDTSNRKLIQRRLEPDEKTSASDGVYWAVYLGSCGHVVVTPERIRFRSLFARKMNIDVAAGGDLAGAEESEQNQVSVLDPVTGKCQVTESQLKTAKVRTLVDLQLESVTQLRKMKSVSVGVWGIDGLEVKSKGGKVHLFSSIVKRDEAFNRILALSSQGWKEV
ncbi:hypothetical protein CBS101457_000763 [Exobasidium rhododendri]|nr:hypothetical protein CBS101457_000763 [Exobasidium rhododendri]